MNTMIFLDSSILIFFFLEYYKHKMNTGRWCDTRPATQTSPFRNQKLNENLTDIVGLGSIWYENSTY